MQCIEMDPQSAELLSEKHPESKVYHQDTAGRLSIVDKAAIQ